MGRLLSIFALFVFCAAGCIPAPYYQKQVAIPNNAWSYNYKPMFRFEVRDTSAKYRTYFIIQHTQAYPFSNLWMLAWIKAPGDTIAQKRRVQVTMADATGKWLGRGMGAIYEERIGILFGDDFTYNKPGTYEITLEQNMRVNPLNDVLHVGLRVEKGSTEGLR